MSSYQAYLWHVIHLFLSKYPITAGLQTRIKWKAFNRCRHGGHHEWWPTPLRIKQLFLSHWYNWRPSFQTYISKVLFCRGKRFFTVEKFLASLWFLQDFKKVWIKWKCEIVLICSVQAANVAESSSQKGFYEREKCGIFQTAFRKAVRSVRLAGILCNILSLNPTGMTCCTNMGCCPPVVPSL